MGIKKQVIETFEITWNKQLIFDIAFVFQKEINPLLIRAAEIHGIDSKAVGKNWKYLWEYEKLVEKLTGESNLEEKFKALKNTRQSVFRRLYEIAGYNLLWFDKQFLIDADILIPVPPERRLAALDAILLLMKADSSGVQVYCVDHRFEFSFSRRISSHELSSLKEG